MKFLKDFKFLQKYKAQNQSVKIVILIIGTAVLWMLSGIFSTSDELLSDEKKVTRETRYKIHNSEGQIRHRVIRLNGITKAKQVVNLISELSGKVDELIAKQGDFLKRGDVILKIDEKNKRELLEEAKAHLKQRELGYKSAQTLFKKKLRSEVELKEAEAKMEEAKAKLKHAEIEMNNTTIKAPFDGYIDYIEVEKGDYLSAQRIVGKFISINPLLVKVEIPQRIVAKTDYIKKSKIFFEDGISGEGKVVFVSKIATKDQNSFSMEIETENTAGLPSGMSVKVELWFEKEFAHLIPQYVIALDKKGNPGVKILDDENIVRFQKIRIVDESEEGLWVGGLGKKAKIVTLGHAYLEEGQSLKNLLDLR